MLQSSSVAAGDDCTSSPRGAAESSAAARRQPYVDDVSGFNQTPVAAVVSPRCEADVQRVIANAARLDCKVAMRGTQHTMGGQTIAPGGVILDLKRMNRVLAIDVAARTVTCEPGATWTDLIAALNGHGLSPRTMQSYSSFSVGGTLAVNGHGITTDLCVAESVLSFDVVIHDGTIVRDCGPHREEESLERRLARLVLGGYGMFGVITRVTMRVNSNHTLQAEAFPISPGDFATVYEQLSDASCGNDVGPPSATHDVSVDRSDDRALGKDIDVKLARLNVTNPDEITMYTFRRLSPLASVGKLAADPRQMGLFSQLLYKWLLPPLQELRAAVEQQTGTALDWTDAVDKNTLMYETAEPLARLSEPMYLVDDTFILQEYFVPCAAFQTFVASVKPIYSDLAATASSTVAHDVKNEDEAPSSARISLLNTTIRHVKADTYSALPYSPQDTFAFVLYYRVARNEASYDALAEYHAQFTAAALAVGGSFYLPYLHHYTSSDLEQAYPGVRDFFAAKEELDPHCRFDSAWLRDYGVHFVSDKYRHLIPYEAKDTSSPEGLRGVLDVCDLTKASDNESVTADDDYELPVVSEQRTDSYRRLLASPRFRAQFRQQFLEHVFNIKDATTVYNLMNRTAWDRRNTADLDIYLALTQAFANASGPLTPLVEAVKGLRQVSSQKAQLAGETYRILARLGRLGTVHDYVSVGDHGKLVVPFREVLGMRGSVYIVHDTAASPHDINAAIERGSTEPPCNGTTHLIDYYGRCVFTNVPDACCDLLTMNQGLHHIPQRNLLQFLSEVRRVLRPGGLFIVREHDATPELIPMVDLAHSVFNAVTGVSLSEEKAEIRAFRPVAEWRDVVTRGGGLQDLMQGELQRDDPTLDHMLCFAKESSIPNTVTLERSAELELAAADGASTAAQQQPQQVVPFQGVIEGLPKDVLRAAQSALDSAAGLLPGLAETLSHAAPPGQRDILKNFVLSATGPVARALEKLRAQTDHVQPRGLSVALVPGELLHAYAALNLKAKAGRATAQETLAVGVIDHVAQQVFGLAASGPQQSTTTTAATEGGDSAATAVTTDEGSASPASSLDDGPVKPEDVAAQLERLLPLYAHVLKQNSFVWSSEHGFPSAVADAVQKALPPTAVDDPAARFHAATKLAAKVDALTWQHMCSAIDEIVSCDPPPRFHFDDIVGRASSSSTDHPQHHHHHQSPWNRLALAFLGSPKVYFTGPTLLAARWYGVPELDSMWRTGRQQYEERAAARRAASGATAGKPLRPGPHGGAGAVLPEADLQQLANAMRGLDSQVEHVTMRGQEIRTLTGVADVLHASYQGRDVTKIVKRDLFNPATGQVQLILDDLDSIFDYGLTPLSVYFYGERCLTLTYRSAVAEPPATAMVEAARSAVQLLVSRRVIPAESFDPRHPRRERLLAAEQDYNLYKLAEWLQVELLRDFGANLSHAPWYRYPFAGVTSTYWGVLKQLSGDVWARRGFRAAFLSPGFMTSFVPGVVMAAMFAQLRLLAAPLLATFGDSYDNGSTPLSHRVVLRHRGRARDAVVTWPHAFQHHSLPVRPLVGELFLADVPVFGDFTPILVAAAMHEWTPQSAGNDGPITLLSVQGHETVHVKVAGLQRSISSSTGGVEGQQRSSQAYDMAGHAEPVASVAARFEGAAVITAFDLPLGADSAALQRRLVLEYLLTQHRAAVAAASAGDAAADDGERRRAPPAAPVDLPPHAVLPPLQYASVQVPVVKLTPFIRYCRRHRLAVVQVYDFFTSKDD